MQSPKIDVNKQIQIVVRSGKVALGIKEALDAGTIRKGQTPDPSLQLSRPK